jgi:hypothetical protein
MASTLREVRSGRHCNPFLSGYQSGCVQKAIVYVPTCQILICITRGIAIIMAHFSSSTNLQTCKPAHGCRGPGQGSTGNNKDRTRGDTTMLAVESWMHARITEPREVVWVVGGCGGLVCVGCRYVMWKSSAVSDATSYTVPP